MIVKVEHSPSDESRGLAVKSSPLPQPHIEAPVQTPAAGSSSHPDDLPPPYVGRGEPTSTSSQERETPQRAASHLQTVAQQEVNYVVLEARHSSISGSYILNTELPASQSLLSCRRNQIRALDSKNRKFLKHEKNAAPNASVHTRHGSIALNLATAGQTGTLSRAHVQVSSRHGKAHVNVYSLQPNKHICLEVITRHNNIVVFVPPNFQGALQFRTRRGNIKFLPEFERWARLVNASDHGALVLFGQDLQSTVDWSDPGSDSCLLSTRHGKIVVGVSGVDHYDEIQGPGFLEKLGSLSMLLLGTDVTTRLRTEVNSFNARLQQRQQPQ